MQTPAQPSEGPALDPTESDAGDATQGHEPSDPRPDAAASLPGATESAPVGGTETTAASEQVPEAHAHDGVPRRRRRRRRRKPMDVSVSSESVSAAPSEASAPVAPAGEGEAGADARPEDALEPRPILRLRNRRRRRRRPPVGAPSPSAGSTPDSTAEPAAGDGVASAGT